MIVKANQQWKDNNDVIYTVLEVRTGWLKGWQGKIVRAFTFDLSVEEKNGTWEGRKCHWVLERKDFFAEDFRKVE